MILYELHLPLVMLANRALQRGPGSTDGMGPKEIKAYLKVKSSFMRNNNCFMQKPKRMILFAGEPVLFARIPLYIG